MITNFTLNYSSHKYINHKQYLHYPLFISATINPTNIFKVSTLSLSHKSKLHCISHHHFTINIPKTKAISTLFSQKSDVIVTVLTYGNKNVQLSIIHLFTGQEATQQTICTFHHEILTFLALIQLNLWRPYRFFLLRTLYFF